MIRFSLGALAVLHYIVPDGWRARTTFLEPALILPPFAYLGRPLHLPDAGHGEFVVIDVFHPNPRHFSHSVGSSGKTLLLEEVAKHLRKLILLFIGQGKIQDAVVAMKKNGDSKSRGRW
jgi:hypothetical protein